MSDARAPAGAHLVLVGAGVMGAGYLDAAARLGVPVRLADFAASAERSRAQAEHVVAVDSPLDEAWFAGALRALDGRRPAGVVAFSEPHVLAAALLQDAFALPGPGLRAATVSRNKALQRAVFAAAGVPQPEHLLTASLHEASAWARARFPVVVKPLSGAGSEGVELVPDAAAFAAAVARRGGEGKLLVERAVEGPEFSCECLVRETRILFTNVTAKETTGPPRFVETCHRPGHAFGSRAQCDAVEAFTRDVVGALGMRTGIVHLEFRLAEEGPVLMEVAVRTPGDYLMDVVSLTCRIDLFEAVLRLALALPLPRAGTAPVQYAAARFFLPAPGRVTAVRGLDDVRAHPAVLRCVVKLQPGDVVRRPESSMDRAGHVLVRGRTPLERDQALRFVDDTLVIETA